MSKIVKFRTSTDNIVEAIEQLLEKAKSGQVKGFVFAAKCDDGNIATAWSEVDIGERNELTAHMQTDIMFDVVAANIDRLIEYV